ncbi:MAG TPA: acetylesterase [Gammaproteobacteria bacterium]|jgi:acetyl esterase|nr:alpha/beta hydrolase fold domain-containing protein [Arenicellales bacterium]MDP6552867.1 alpha/beta hydrolase fold domain-containing protein [Arenicellales bacterium]MDP6791059.1 alpha/beta hydrolase fold domain-containing protein [Arenicellales bacterium]MDP6919067.1 alpha/beta hydrolase fold domain-containing protein [Arenicellales bacterium]HCX88854.1 acetylesterase [Gammaproteobacteria bacterium]|tara:strand:- start:2064 stop:3005 length:942 start_codon:yes stop_codon:yes gene_type:complete
MQLDPQMIAVMKKRAVLASRPDDPAALPIEAVRKAYNAERAWWNAIKPEMGSVSELAVTGPVRDIPIRIYCPQDADEGPTLLYLHGGGWVVGNLDTHDRVMRLLAEFSGARVVGVDYALAPEYRFPVAINEALAVINWLRVQGEDHGLDASRLGLGGDSAGANMAVAATQLCHQQNAGMIQFLLLYYGTYGLTESQSWQQYGNAEYEFTPEESEFYLASYLASDQDKTDSRFKVLSGNIDLLPMAFIGAAECDPLRDDSIALHKAMQAAGRPAILKIYPGVLHSFIHYSRMLDKATEALRDGASALKTALTAP